MHALLFEVLPKPEGRAQYFALASALRPILDTNPGLLFIDRYDSLARPGWILSHSLWRDEASLARWRSNEDHYGAQCAGRRRLFEDYRLRIGMVIDEWAPTEGSTWMSEAGAYNDPNSMAPRFFAVVASRDEPAALVGFEAFRSVYRENECLAVGSIGTRADFAELVDCISGLPNLTSMRAALVSRDYGMYERTEAPQFLARSPG